MSTEWSLMTLKEAGVHLLDCVHKTPKAESSGYPYIAIPQMKNGRIDFDSARLINPEDYQLWTKKAKPKYWDVVLSRRCNPGATAHVSTNFEFALGQNLVLLRSDGGNVFPPFLRWLTSSPAWWEQVSKFINVGAVFDSLKCKDIPDFSLLIPPLPEQRAIAEILSSLDDKIELNNRMNRTLEEMAQAIFKQWFVDFEFPNADGNPYKSSGGEMVDSELGPIPKGWRVEPLDDIADFLNGLALQKFRPTGDEYLPVLKIADLRNGTPNHNEKAEPGITEKYIIQDGDIIFSWSGSLLVKIWTGGKCALNQHLFKVTSEDYPKWFYLEWVKYHLARFQGIAADKATTMGHIKRKDLSDSMTFVPDNTVLNQADSILGPLIEQQLINDLENRRLTSIRDTLLPKLMSGELRVPAVAEAMADRPDVEQMVEEVSA